MKSLLFTLDYELYGNGSGDVFKHIIEPTEKILKLAETYKAKITIYFEVIEYWRLKEEWEKGNRMGYDQNPIEAMEQQMKKAYRDGHDIQLHLHPQWVDAVWTDDGWKVNIAQWRLGDYQGTGDNSLINLLQRGKETIELIINDPDYHCIALRAGGYNAQPSSNLVEAMKKVGLKVDSSIYPGGKETGTLSRYDYSQIEEDTGMWYCDNNLEDSVGHRTDLMEFPIVALLVLRIQKYLSIDRIKSFLQNYKSAKDTFVAKTNESKGGLIGKLQYFFQYESQTWDYCLFSKRMHHKFLEAIEKQRSRKVFVLVGHPKNFVSDKGLGYLLKKTRGVYIYDTITEVYHKCNEGDSFV